jgi:hypothetical protein
MDTKRKNCRGRRSSASSIRSVSGPLCRYFDAAIESAALATKRLADLRPDVAIWARSRRCRIIPVFNTEVLSESLATIIDQKLNCEPVKLCAIDNLDAEAKIASALDEAVLASRLLSFAESAAISFKHDFLNGLAITHGAIQFSALASGYVLSPCPFSGAYLRSRHSFTIAVDGNKQSYIFYRFRGLETFYIVVSGWGARKTLLYLPRLELALQLSDQQAPG